LRNKNELKKILEKKTMAELLTLAKKVGVTGYSGKKKSELIASILKTKSNLNSVVDDVKDMGAPKDSWFGVFWKKYVDGYIRVSTAIIAAMIAIATAITKCSDDWKLFYRKSFEGDETALKVLILPLTPDRDCNIEDTNFENLISDHYKEIGKNLSLRLKIEINRNYPCPSSDDEVIKIGETEKADMVIWGNFDEHCSGPLKIRNRYTFVKEFGFLNPRSGGDLSMKEVEDLSQLRSGILLRDVDYIVYRTLSIFLVNLGEYDKVLKVVEKIGDIGCDFELLGIKILAGLQLKKSNLSPTFNQVTTCMEKLNDDMNYVINSSKIGANMVTVEMVEEYELQLKKRKALYFYIKKHKPTYEKMKSGIDGQMAKDEIIGAFLKTYKEQIEKKIIVPKVE